MITRNSKDLSTKQIYNLLIGSICPRPIALVTTIDERGVVNLAPFSSYNLVSSKPACVSFSIARRADGSKKDTLRNLETIPELVINSAHSDILEEVVLAGAEYPAAISEIERCALEVFPSEEVRPPRLKKSLIQMEAKIYQTFEIGEGLEGSATLVIAEILKFHLAPAIFENERIKHLELNSLARLGGITYSTIGTTWERKIPKV